MNRVTRLDGKRAEYEVRIERLGDRIAELERELAEARADGGRQAMSHQAVQLKDIPELLSRIEERLRELETAREAESTLASVIDLLGVRAREASLYGIDWDHCTADPRDVIDRLADNGAQLRGQLAAERNSRRYDVRELRAKAKRLERERDEAIAEKQRERTMNRSRLREQEIADLRAALEKIAEGAGPFSRDPHTHAVNCIEAMKKLARDALAEDDDG